MCHKLALFRHSISFISGCCFPFYELSIVFSSFERDEPLSSACFSSLYSRCFQLHPWDIMARPTFKTVTAVAISALALANGQTSATPSNSPSQTPIPTITGTPVTNASSTSTIATNTQFTVPASADEGANLIPTIQDPQAINAQDACPGYKLSQLREDDHGLTAILKLAGKPCNAYGTDIETLNLTVEYQSKTRLSVNISPANIVSSGIIFGENCELIAKGCLQLFTLHTARRLHSTAEVRLHFQGY